MAAIKISLVADVRSFVSSFRKGTESVEDLVDEVKDLADAGDDTARSMVKDLDRIADASKKAGKQVEGGLKEGFDDAAKEAGQSGRETAASFSGGFDDVVGFAQETMANALGGFGPLGSAAGIALAVGIGAGLSALAAEQEKIDAARESAKELAEVLYENNGELPINDQISKTFDLLTAERGARGIEGWINQWADLGTNLDLLKSSAKAAKTPVGDLIKALTGGDLNAVKRQLEAVDKALEGVNERTEFANGEDLFSNAATAQNLQSVKSLLEGQINALELVEAATAEVNATYGETPAQIEAATRATEEQATRIADLSSAWQNAAVDASNYWLTNEEGVSSFDWNSYLADAEIASAQADEFKRRIVTMPPEIAAEGTRLFAAQGAAAANAYLTSFEGAGTEGQARAIAVATVNGEAYGTAQATGIVTGFGTPSLTADVTANVVQPPATAFDMLTNSVANLKPKVTPVADVAPATTAIEKIADAKYEATIDVKAETTRASADIASAAAVSHSATITVGANLGNADYQIRHYSPPTVYVPAVLVKPGTRQPI